VDVAPPLINVRAPLLGVCDRLDLVDRRLGRLELLAGGDDGARLLEALTQRAGPRIRPVRAPVPQETGGDGANRGGRSTQEGEPAPHLADATLRDSSCPVLRRTFPIGAPDEAARPKEGGRRET
jgi:hypothetical protein